MSDVERRDEGIVDRIVEWTLLDGSRWTVAGGSLVPIAVLLGWMAGAARPHQHRAAPVLVQRPDRGELHADHGRPLGQSARALAPARGSRRGSLADRGGTRLPQRGRSPGTTGVAPVLPPEFFLLLLETTRRQAQELGGLVAHHASDGLRDDVDGLVETVTARIDHTRELYDRSDTGIIEILVAALDTNYAGQTRDAREIKRAHEDALSDRGAERSGSTGSSTRWRRSTSPAST